MKTLNLVVIALLVGPLLSACGRSDTVYFDGVTGVVGTDGRSALPNGFYDQSVNHAMVDIATDLSTDPTAVLHFELSGGTSPAGAFVDATATGNRAILGIGKYDHSALASFSLAVTSASTTSSQLHASLLIDLNCDGTSPVRTVESDDLAIGSATLSTTDAVWSVDGAAITDSSSNVLLPSKTDSSRDSLTALLAAYPSACLRNDRSDAPDAPQSIPIGSLLLSIGSTSSTSIETLDVSSLMINSDLYQTWGER